VTRAIESRASRRERASWAEATTVVGRGRRATVTLFMPLSSHGRARVSTLIIYPQRGKAPFGAYLPGLAHLDKLPNLTPAGVILHPLVSSLRGGERADNIAGFGGAVRVEVTTLDKGTGFGDEHRYRLHRLDQMRNY
jgi:hypothetical protein